MGSTPVIQTSFNAGEWAPALNARVDVQKYHSGAALLRNFFVDYRGGATTRPGSRFILPTRLTSTTRLIPFQASFTVSYILEFGQNYIRFYNNGAPVLEAAGAITGITNANPGVITDPAHGLSNGDWVFLSGIGGTTQLNGNYYIVAGVTTNTFTLTDLLGNPIDTTTFGVYTSGGTDQRVYTLLTSPYVASELAQIKFAQNVNTLILCHPNHPPYQLVLNSATNWTLTAITFGATVSAPTGVAVATTLAAGSVFYAYIVTAVDVNGQESRTSTPGTLASLQDLRSVAGTNTVTWSPVTGATSYNVYKAEPAYGSAVASGAQYGFIGNCTGTTFADSNIAPDFAQGVPVVQNPYAGAGVVSLGLTSGGANYTSTPAVTFSGGSPTVPATAYCYLHATSVGLVNQGIAPYNGGVQPPATLTLGYGVTVNVGYSLGIVAPYGNVWLVTSVTLATQGALSGSAPANPVTATTGGFFVQPTFNLAWNVGQLFLSTPGSGYSGAPTVGFSGGGGSGASATATIGAASVGNPTVPGFFQQRLVLAGPVNSPQQFNMSQPGSFYNFNINNPIEADDAIQGTLVSGQLNTIQSMVTQPQGLILFSDKQAWLINGGSPGSAVSAIQIVANSQAYNGASYPPPIVANDNVLYVQAKGSIVRDLVFNFYTQVYTGADISVLSSHLFYGYQVKEWAWAEEPFKVVWAVRSDGTLLSLTFLKEQELVAWAHSDTQGNYQSVASVTETTASGSADAVYSVVQRGVQVASVVSATWSPTDVTTGLTLSSGNLKATSSANTDMAVRATQGFSTGKYYFEVTIGTTYSGAHTGMGVMTATAARDTFGVNGTGGIIVYASGNVNYNGAAAFPTLGALLHGEVIGVAVDLVNMRFWARRNNGFWNGLPGANPATNVSGVSISSVFGAAAAFPVQAFGPSASGSFSTANFGATAFAFGPPSGFSSWSVPGPLSPVQYVERFAEQNYSGNLAAAWCVDAGIAYSGAGALTFSGAQHLGTLQVTGIATDNNGNTAAITPFTMPSTGTFTLPAPASPATNYTYVLVGLAFVPQLQTLAIDLGEPTVQGKRKKITAVTVRVKDALGLSIGGDVASLTPMKDLVVGNVGTMTNTTVANLVTGDARTIIDPKWSVPGQYFIQQSNPFPASILGVIPEITVGDTQK